MTGFEIDPRLAGLKYEENRFADVYSGVGPMIWEALCRSDNVIRMETATYLERAAVEPLGAALLERFGAELNQDRYRQMIGHMVRQIMEALGYELDRPNLRLTRLNMFTTGAAYRPKNGGRDRSKKIEREDRNNWAENAADTPFNAWLKQKAWSAKSQDWDTQALYDVAREHGVVVEDGDLSPAQLRLVVGAKLYEKVRFDNQDN